MLKIPTYETLKMPYFRNTTPSKVLFLTTEDPSTIKAEPDYQNWMLPALIKERGADVSLLCWRNPDLDATTISAFDIVTFLWCNDYHLHPKSFPAFVESILIPAQTLKPNIHIFNDPRIVLWNMDKHYLQDLAGAGFAIPRTEFIDLRKQTKNSLISTLSSFSESHPLVLKPAISSSAKMTHSIKTLESLTSEDSSFLDLVLTEGTSGDLIIQEYAENISQGEYSLIFIDGTHSHTILKTPQTGEFRCQAEFGGSTRELNRNEVPQGALETAQQLVRYIEEKFDAVSEEGSGKGLVYARIDGIMRGEDFVLMEFEAIEPHLWLEADSCEKGMEELCKVFLQAG
ncbi:hypothetical protein ABVK25_008061 [Lepraria finkii]|uniref:Prokaryotic glutathione synthetase ATP-binding domain-containing protein n=1 Tax=Lepraria finkii TaxID=1340010 RepID=A0ABR4B306_9LECA